MVSVRRCLDIYLTSISDIRKEFLKTDSFDRFEFFAEVCPSAYRVQICLNSVSGLKFFDKRAEFKFCINRDKLFHIRSFIFEIFPPELDRSHGVDGSQPFGHPGNLNVIAKVLAHLALDFISVIDKVLKASVLLKKRYALLLSDSRNSRNVV